MLAASTGDAALIICDTIVIGAGPVGQFQVFELGLLGLRAHVIDSMAQAGGQCVELYPDKPIYDIPALPVCSGRELIERLQQQIGRMQFCEGGIIGLETADGALSQVRVRSRSGMVQRIEASPLLVFWGLHPALGLIADWGLALERQQLTVNPATFQTSVPGSFAVGDINTYPGKKKLILCGFHEAALCAFAARAHLNPGEHGALAIHDAQPGAAAPSGRARGRKRRRHAATLPRAAANTA
jgi:thioredoxin reductase